MIVLARHSGRPASYRGTMQVQISPEAAALARANGGELWIWAARPRMCCGGAPAWTHAAFSQPSGRTGFIMVEVAGDAKAEDAKATAAKAANAKPAEGAAGLRTRFPPLRGG